MSERMAGDSECTLKGKRAVITGGLGLLGEAIVRAIAAAGAKVIILDINHARWEEVQLDYQKSNMDVSFMCVDLTDLGMVASYIEGIESEYGALDVWVNNAYPRTDDWGLPLEGVTAESWQKNIDLQLNSYCICANEIGKRMAQRGAGCIINVASIYGVIAPDFSIYEGTDMTCPPAYSAIKGGVIAYSKYLASYFGRNGVRVNAVCPGGVLNNQPDGFLKRYSAKTLLGRLASPEEIALPIMFLASDAASYITGQVIMIDGGLSTI